MLILHPFLPLPFQIHGLTPPVHSQLTLTMADSQQTSHLYAMKSIESYGIETS